MHRVLKWRKCKRTWERHTGFAGGVCGITCHSEGPIKSPAIAASLSAIPPLFLASYSIFLATSPSPQKWPPTSAESTSSPRPALSPPARPSLAASPSPSLLPVTPTATATTAMRVLGPTSPLLGRSRPVPGATSVGPMVSIRPDKKNLWKTVEKGKG